MPRFSFPFPWNIHTSMVFGNLRSHLTALLTSPILTARPSRLHLLLAVWHEIRGVTDLSLFPLGSEGLEAGILHAHCFLVTNEGLLGK